jgi:probable HAF family extracellular repeat protein
MLPDGSKIALSPNLDQSFAYDINNSGMIVGAAGPVGSEHAHVWTLAGGATDIGTLGGAWAIAYGISDNHVVVGVSETAGAEIHGFRWTAGGGMVDLGLANDNWDAVDVNLFGRIVGNRTGGVMDGSHGYARLPSGFTFLHGLVPQGDRRARAVNRCGWIAGNATSSSGTAHAVLWTKPVCD